MSAIFQALEMDGEPDKQTRLRVLFAGLSVLAAVSLAISAIAFGAVARRTTAGKVGLFGGIAFLIAASAILLGAYL